MSHTQYFTNETEMLRYAINFAAQLRPGDHIHLHGDLGAGKTTFTRGVITALGYTGKIKSPTYTLLESYTLPIATIHHLDLYRLQCEDDFFLSGLEDPTQDPAAINLIEWPCHALAALPPATQSLFFAIHATSHSITS